jgi:hypothetical protein
VLWHIDQKPIFCFRFSQIVIVSWENIA